MAELASAQRRLRRRAMLIAASGAVLVAAGLGALWWRGQPPPDPPPIVRPYLWRVDGEHPSYLLGTLHIAYGFDDLPASVRAAFARSTMVVVESDLLADASPAAPAASAASAPDGGRARLTADEWRRLARVTGEPEATLVGLPSAQLLGTLLASQTRSIEPMDRGIQARATAARKEVVVLEDRDLTAVTDGAGRAMVSEAEVLDQVRMIAAQPEALRVALRRIVRAYADGGARGCGPGAMADFVDELNADWLAAIERAVARGDAFVAIGCAHLEGPDGVLARLRARGRTITRVER